MELDPLGRRGCERTVSDYTALSAAFFDTSPYVQGVQGVVSEKVQAIGGAWGDYLPFNPRGHEADSRAMPWPLVYVSDGGHSDNTGAYSLVINGRKTILMIDAGQDPRGLMEDIMALKGQLQGDYEFTLCEIGVGDEIPFSRRGCGHGREIDLTSPQPGFLDRGLSCRFNMQPDYHLNDGCDPTTKTLIAGQLGPRRIPHPLLFGTLRNRKAPSDVIRLVVIKPRLLEAYLSFPEAATVGAHARSKILRELSSRREPPNHIIDAACKERVGPAASEYVCYKHLMEAHLVEACGVSDAYQPKSGEATAVQRLTTKWSGLMCGIRIEDGFPHVSTLDFDYEADRYVAFYVLGRHYGRVAAKALDCIQSSSVKRSSPACGEAGVSGVAQ